MSKPHTGEKEPYQARGKRRRWLLGLEPFFEAKMEGKRAAEWNVEDELVAVAFLGDVTIDLSHAGLAEREIVISAWAIVRDVEIIVSPGTRVELFGSVVWGDLTSMIPTESATTDRPVVRIEDHTLFGDVDVKLPNAHD